MQAIELIRTVETAGGRFLIDGDRLGIVPASAVQPVLEEVRRKKFEIIDLLQRLPAMPAGVRLVSWCPREAPVRLSECETVTDIDRFIRSTLRQVDARLSGKGWMDGGWTLSVLLDRLKACGCLVKLDNPREALQ